MSGSTFTPSTDVGDQPLKAQTLANGTFQISGIPSGMYSVRIDHVTPIDGYDEPAVIVNGANVQFGFAQDLGTITLTRTQQKATLSFAGLAAGDALTGSTAKLVNSADPSWQLPADVVGANSITFNTVPFGCWSLDADPAEPAFRHGLAHHRVRYRRQLQLRGSELHRARRCDVRHR